VERFIETTAQLCLGDPLDENTEQGAIVNKPQLDKVNFTSISLRRRRQDRARRFCTASA